MAISSSYLVPMDTTDTAPMDTWPCFTLLNRLRTVQDLIMSVLVLLCLRFVLIFKKSLGWTLTRRGGQVE